MIELAVFYSTDEYTLAGLLFSFGFSMRNMRITKHILRFFFSLLLLFLANRTKFIVYVKDVRRLYRLTRASKEKKHPGSFIHQSTFFTVPAHTHTHTLI